MEDFSNEEMEQLLAVFREQTLHILDEMCQDLLALESREDGEVMARLRRAAHTIKGDSACIGLEGVTEISHRVEDLIDRSVRAGSGFDREAVDLILECVDAIKSSVGGERVSDIPAQAVSLLAERIGELDARGPAAAINSELTRSVVEGKGRKEEDAVVPAEKAPRAGRQFLRVEAGRVDTLLNLAGEMVIARSLAEGLSAELERTLPRNDLAVRVVEATHQMGKLIQELQKGVLKMRMVTMDQLFKRFTRPMRELAAASGKQVRLEMSGGETEVDRALVDLLYEPLLHLLRNAVDHGLETPVEREAVFKPAAATLWLRAYHEGNQVVVEVADDGRGIDREKLRARAVEAGLVSAEEGARLTDEEGLGLVFEQGLSTAERVTKVSGRGVGASAVKAVVEQLRGGVSVRSEQGMGTVFQLRLPLTLAIIRALLFTSAGRLLAFPLLSVSEIVRADSDEIIYLDGVESFRHRGRFVSLVRAGVALGFERRRGGRGQPLRGEGKDLFIIVLNAGDKRYAVAADELHGEQELVIKPLDGGWVDSEALAGASVLGDGRVVLILDAPVVYQKAVKYERSRDLERTAYGN